ncbi:hypothetical protein TGVAND_277690 [Toxoplasma gondii VAND]|uniref:DUF1279 domain-containing protein n=1 Tax=Toxoplasma gondii VAND TaxID=933077 RepID=A0A086QA19_TOXGO|nr:hypothetical protein TGVAND_277690 [Toxoplasma gondii VAND]
MAAAASWHFARRVTPPRPSLLSGLSERQTQLCRLHAVSPLCARFSKSTVPASCERRRLSSPPSPRRGSPSSVSSPLDPPFSSSFPASAFPLRVPPSAPLSAATPLHWISSSVASALVPRTVSVSSPWVESLLPRHSESRLFSCYSRLLSPLLLRSGFSPQVETAGSAEPLCPHSFLPLSSPVSPHRSFSNSSRPSSAPSSSSSPFPSSSSSSPFPSSSSSSPFPSSSSSSPFPSSSSSSPFPSSSSSSPSPHLRNFQRLSVDTFARFSRDPVAFFRRCRMQYPVPLSWRGASAQSVFRKTLEEGKMHWRQAKGSSRRAASLLAAGKNRLRSEWETRLFSETDRRAFLERQKAKLRAQRQQLLRLVLRQQRSVQERGLLWLDMRRRKVEATLLRLQQSGRMQQLRRVKSQVFHQGKRATERLKGLWEKYGWASVLAYAGVHCGTFLALFGLAQMISDESVQRVADLLHLDKIIDKEALINEKSAFWGRLLFAYAACKPLTPVQVAVAFWCTPHLARFMGRRGIPVHVSKATVTHLRGKLRFRRRKSCEKNTL